MTDRLEEIAAGLIDGGIDYPTFADVEWLIAEVRALRKRIVTLEERCALIDADGDHAWDEYHAVRQRHAEAVEQAFRDGAWAVCSATDLDGDVTKRVVDAAWTRYQQERQP